jgi:hypothetical protein
MRSGWGEHVLPESRAQHAVLYGSTNRSHLGIDKRYQGKRSIQAIAPGLSFPALVFHSRQAIVAYTPDTYILSADRSIASPRGPPCA